MSLGLCQGPAVCILEIDSTCSGDLPVLQSLHCISREKCFSLELTHVLAILMCDAHESIVSKPCLIYCHADIMCNPLLMVKDL